MAWQLEVIEGADSGLKAVLLTGTLNIGRDVSQSSFVLNDDLVSHLHARVTLSEDGTVQVADANSTNGTYVNGQKISKAVKLNPEDDLKIGNTRVRLIRVYEKSTAAGMQRGQTAITIGRETSNDLIINNPEVSRNHARIDRQNNKFYLTDLDSSHGTLLNGERIKGKICIEPSSWIQIYGFNFFFDGINLKNEKGIVVASFKNSFKARLVSIFNVKSRQPLYLIAAASVLFVVVTVSILLFGLRNNTQSISLNHAYQVPMSVDQTELYSHFGLPGQYLILFEYDKQEVKRVDVWAYPEVQFYYTFLNGEYINGDNVVFPDSKPDAYRQISPLHFWARMNPSDLADLVGERGRKLAGVQPATRIYSFGEGALICFFNDQELLVAVYRSFDMPDGGIK